VFRLFKKVWIPLLLVVVVVIGTYAVVRIRDSFGVEATAAAADGTGDETKPFNPKHITYEITGPPGGIVNVDYLDENGQPHRVDAAPLPWAYTVVTTLPSMSANAEFAHVEVGRGHTPRVSLRDEKSVGRLNQSWPRMDA
jgi:hypothetical protein